MNIIKFNDFVRINEDINDTPEEYVKIVLTKIKNKLEKMFANQNPDEVEKIGDRNSKEKSGETLKGLELQSCELSRYSKLQDSVKIKYSDETFLYDLTISIDLKEAIPTDPEKEFTSDDIKKCHIKFKKYDTDQFNLIGEISKNIDVKDINEDLLVSLKIQIDDEFGDEGEDEFEIETE